MSDNIYSANCDCFTHLDTLYFGVICGLVYLEDTLENIKNYLSSKCLCKFKKSKGNTYYTESWIDEDNGVFIYCFRRENCKNDDLTIQLGGKFFRDYQSSYEAVNWFLNNFLVNIQRVDTAIDLCYEGLPMIENDFTNNKGFPTPSINFDYHYKTNPMKIYSRRYNELNIVNMISCGGKDVLLRVYDKELELLETKKMTFSDYYMTEKQYRKVFRIELQARGQLNKGFIYTLMEKKPLTYDNMVECYVDHIFRKYVFRGIEKNKIKNKISFSKIKKEKSLKEQYEYAKKMQNSYYKRAVDIAEKIYYLDSIEECCSKINGLKDIEFDLYEMYAKVIKGY